jgi:hypothetical protein
MLLQSINHKSVTLAVVAALAAVSVQVREAYADGPFARFAGAWRGDGKISMSDGTHESIRCRVTYSIANAGVELTQELTCASQSYKFDVSSQVHARGSQLSGSWTETTRGVTGRVSGSVTDGTILATVTGAGFSAGLSLNIRGNSQYVEIKPVGATDVVDVRVALKKS